MNLTDYLAIYGAVLSSIGFIWHVYKSNKDKAKIVVNANFGFFGSSGGAEGPFFFVKAINKGQRPINLSSVGIRLDNDEDLINLRTFTLPKKLEEGSSHSEWFILEDLKDKKCLFAWYKDETGKLYKSKSIKKKLNNYFRSKVII